MRHALLVTFRAGAATLVVALGAVFVSPSLAIAIPLVAAAAVMIVVFEATRIRATLLRRLDELEADIAQTQPLVALAHRLPMRRPLPMMRGFAIAPDFALYLAELIAEEEPELVVETGSGVSTLVIAYALEKLGSGRVIALEHDPAYARRTREELARHGLTAIATVVDAPLEPVAIRGETFRWYAPRALDGLPAIDLVVDDGPPRHIGPMLRYASLPMFAERMSTRGAFVLDVIGEEERTVLARWRDELPELSQQEIASKKGHVLIRRMVRPYA